MTGEDKPDRWADPETVSKRLFRSLVIFGAGMTTAGLVFGGPKMAAGIALGGVLALLNFRWLVGSVRSIMAVGCERVPPGTAMKIGLRWLAVGIAGYAGYLTGYFAAAGILIGLLAPAPAVLFESMYLTLKTVRPDSRQRLN
jgi:hypothetical protein